MFKNTTMTKTLTATALFTALAAGTSLLANDSQQNSTADENLQNVYERNNLQTESSIGRVPESGDIIFKEAKFLSNDVRGKIIIDSNTTKLNNGYESNSWKVLSIIFPASGEADGYICAGELTHTTTPQTIEKSMTGFECGNDVYNQYKTDVDNLITAYLDIYKPNNAENILFEPEDFFFKGYQGSVKLKDLPGEPLYFDIAQKRLSVAIPYDASEPAKVCTYRYSESNTGRGRDMFNCSDEVATQYADKVKTIRHIFKERVSPQEVEKYSSALRKKSKNYRMPSIM